MPTITLEHARRAALALAQHTEVLTEFFAMSHSGASIHLEYAALRAELAGLGDALGLLPSATPAAVVRAAKTALEAAPKPAPVPKPAAVWRLADEEDPPCDVPVLAIGGSGLAVAVLTEWLPSSRTEWRLYEPHGRGRSPAALVDVRAWMPIPECTAC